MGGINTVLGGNVSISFCIVLDKEDDDTNVSIRSPMRDGGIRSVDMIRCMISCDT